MSPDSLETLMRRYYDAWERNDHETMAALLAPDAITYYLETGDEQDAHYFELSTCELWHSAFTEVRVTFQKVIAAAPNHVSIFWTLDSVHNNNFLGITATNKNVHVPGIEMVRFEDGKLAEIWRIFDQATLMNQLREIKPPLPQE